MGMNYEDRQWFNQCAKMDSFLEERVEEEQEQMEVTKKEIINNIEFETDIFVGNDAAWKILEDRPAEEICTELEGADEMNEEEIHAKYDAYFKRIEEMAKGA